ncbi:MAG TPA: DUF1232 domain-containing protein [Anaerolineae bacterium]|nr:DUF1232 domain-containing protein [Anaerolineae bacterium]
MARFIDAWKQRARALKIDVYALYLAYKDPRIPLYAKVFAACVVGYAFSPIDLIPEPIPILGYLDDLVLVPQGKPVNRTAAVVIIAIWLSVALLLIVLVIRAIEK